MLPVAPDCYTPTRTGAIAALRRRSRWTFRRSRRRLTL